MYASLISALIFATQIEQCLCNLNVEVQASSHLVRSYILVCVGPNIGFLVMQLNLDGAFCTFSFKSVIIHTSINTGDKFDKTRFREVFHNFFGSLKVQNMKESSCL